MISFLLLHSSTKILISKQMSAKNIAVLLSLTLLTLSWKCAGYAVYHCYLKAKKDTGAICLQKVVVCSTEVEVKKRRKKDEITSRGKTTYKQTIFDFSRILKSHSFLSCFTGCALYSPTNLGN